MNSELDVEFLCSAIGVSKTSLFQKMKSITGQSIVEFIRTFRLKKSVQLMTRCPAQRRRLPGWLSGPVLFQERIREIAEPVSGKFAEEVRWDY